MYKLAIIVVNYNGSKFSKRCHDSIATKYDGVEVNFIVVDNFYNENERTLLKDIFSGTSAKIIFLDNNHGYFNALNVGIAFARKTITDLNLIIIGNNDLEFDASLINSLTSIEKLDPNVVVISPNISKLNGSKQNPHSIFGISRFREIIYDLYYSNYSIAKFVIFLSRVLGRWARRADTMNNQDSKFIKLGFGACYIIRPTFFDYYKALWSPMFLMGEELMFSWQLETRGFDIFYYSDINIKHIDNASISKIPSEIIWNSARESHKIYRKFISPWRQKMTSSVNGAWISECSGSLDHEIAINRLDNSIIIDFNSMAEK